MATAKTGSRSTCGYSPLAFNAACCLQCGAPNTRQTRFERIVGRGMLTGILGGILFGAVFGAATEWPPGVGRPVAAFAGGLLGGIPGLILGLIVGLVAAVAAELFGWPADGQVGGFVAPSVAVVLYCGRCRRQQPVSWGDDCSNCGRPTVAWATGRESEADAHRRWVDEDSGPRNPGR